MTPARIHLSIFSLAVLLLPMLPAQAIESIEGIEVSTSTQTHANHDGHGDTIQHSGHAAEAKSYSHGEHAGLADHAKCLDHAQHGAEDTSCVHAHNGNHAEHGESASCPHHRATAVEEKPAQRMPRLVGQDAFSALAEMNSLLTADPTTDWSKVDIDAFREHLVDMNRVVLQADVTVQPVDGGFEARVTGTGRTLESIHRMVPAHSHFIDGRGELNVSVSMLEKGDSPEAGVLVTVTTDDTSAVSRLRGLGFFGFLSSGDHHRPHHWAITTGKGHPNSHGHH